MVKEIYGSVSEHLGLLTLPSFSGKENFTEMVIFKLSLMKDDQELRKEG